MIDINHGKSKRPHVEGVALKQKTALTYGAKGYASPHEELPALQFW
jgi:hypothetical protein